MSKPSLKDIVQGPEQTMFGERDEDGKIPTQTLGLRITKEQHQALKLRAAAKGISMTQAVQQAIDNWLTQEAN